MKNKEIKAKLLAIKEKKLTQDELMEFVSQLTTEYFDDMEGNPLEDRLLYIQKNGIGDLAREIFINALDEPDTPDVGGEGTDYYLEVYYVKPYHIYIKRLSDYYSYEGICCSDNWQVVQKKTKTIFVFEE